VNFTAAHDSSKKTLAGGYWFLFFRDRLVVAETGGGDFTIPRLDGDLRDPALRELTERTRRVVYFGRLDEVDCYAGDLSSDEGLPAGYSATALRPLYGKIPVDIMRPARFAGHLLHWDRSTRYCGTCGGPNDDKADERAKTCPACGALAFPRLSPAVIVAILDGEKILLAHNKRFSAPIYSLIAGFVEMGETLEECVAGEVGEEEGVRVTNIRYFGSQPWPFPDSLMIGFVADYAGGDIRVDGTELHDAKWFSPPDLPNLPASDSIARKIITWYEKEYLPSLGR